MAPKSLREKVISDGCAIKFLSLHHFPNDFPENFEFRAQLTSYEIFSGSAFHIRQSHFQKKITIP
jgi:hypothetical protein